MTTPRPTSTVYLPDVVTPPGESLRDLLEERGLTQTWLAFQVGVSRARISQIVKGARGDGIGPGLALRLEALGLGNARFWLHRQADYDLWKARRAISRKRGRPITTGHRRRKK